MILIRNWKESKRSHIKKNWNENYIIFEIMKNANVSIVFSRYIWNQINNTFNSFWQLDYTQDTNKKFRRMFLFFDIYNIMMIFCIY